VRRRLAGDVHDVVGHTLAAPMLHTSAARRPDVVVMDIRMRRDDGATATANVRAAEARRSSC